jgi:hypothetical protein
VLLITETSSNAINTVDQTKRTTLLTLTSNAQEHHGSLTTSRLVVNSESPLKDGLKEREEMVHGDHSPLTTSGITTTVPKLSVKT